MSQTIRNGQIIRVSIQTGEKLAVVAVTGSYSVTVLSGVGVGTSLATSVTGGTYGPYAYPLVVQVSASAASEIDYDVGVSTNIESDTVALLKTDPLTGGVKEFEFGGVPTLRVPRKKQWLAKLPYGRLKSVAAGADHTTRIQTVLEAHADWVQIGVLNGLAVDLTGVKVCVAPSTTLGSDNSSASITPTGGAWVNATIGGATSGTVLAGTDLNAAKITWFDAMNVSTLERADAGKLPVLMASVELPAANANRPAFNYTTTSGWESEANTFGRVWRSRTKAGLFATAAAAAGFDATTFVGDCLPIVIRYIPRNAEGLCVLVAGDSVHEGAGASPVNHGFAHIARAAVSSLTRPLEICNMAISGATSTQYANRTDSVIASIEPDVVVMAGQTPNNVTPPNITATNVAATYRDIGRMRAAAHSVGALSVLTTGAPWLATDVATLSEDFTAASMEIWNVYRAALQTSPLPVADTESLLIGSTDADGQPVFADGLSADGLHISPAGQTLVAPAVAEVLRRVVF